MSTLHDQTVADEKAEAVADLALLTNFQAAADSGTFTVAQFVQSFGALAPTLNSPDRQKAVADIFAEFQANLAQFAALIAETQAAAA